MDEILLCFEKVLFGFDLSVSFVFYLLMSYLFWLVGLKTAMSKPKQSVAAPVWRHLQIPPASEGVTDVLCNCLVKSHTSYEKFTKRLSPLFPISWVTVHLVLCICRKVVLPAPAPGTSVHTLYSWPVPAQRSWSDIASQGVISDLSGIIKASIYHRVCCLRNPQENFVV